jgi:hypothetical protein
MSAFDKLLYQTNWKAEAQEYSIYAQNCKCSKLQQSRCSELEKERSCGSCNLEKVEILAASLRRD